MSSKHKEDLAITALAYIIYVTLLTIKTVVVYTVLSILAISTSFTVLFLFVTTVELVSELVEGIFRKIIRTSIGVLNTAKDN